MGQLLSTIGKSMGALGNITVILGIIIYIFAVVGMELFGTKYTASVFNDQIPRYNFKDFGNSFMMIFRILCGKWIEPQWDLLRATSAASIIFIFMVFVVGRWVVSTKKFPYSNVYCCKQAIALHSPCPDVPFLNGCNRQFSLLTSFR